MMYVIIVCSSGWIFSDPQIGETAVIFQWLSSVSHCILQLMSKYY
jgi:hypothetical protein